MRTKASPSSFTGYDTKKLKIDYAVGEDANRMERRKLGIYNWDR